MAKTRIFAPATAAALLAACTPVEIEDLAGCYEIEENSAFRIGPDYRVFVNGQPIAQMRMSDTENGARFDSTPGLIAVPGENGYSVEPDPNTPEQAGFVEASLMGNVYMVLPTGRDEAPEIEAYLNTEAEC